MDYKISKFGDVAVSLVEEYRAMDTAPLGVTIQVYTKQGTNTKTILTETQRTAYLGWAPMPAVPDWIKHGR